MPKVLHVSFLWDDDSVNKRHSDYILSMGWVKRGWDVLYFDYRGTAEEYGNDEMNNLLIRIILKHNPDIVWFTKCEGVSRRFGNRSISCKIDPRVIIESKRLGYKGLFIHWYLDQRYNYVKSSIDLGRECEWFFYVSGGNRIKQYSKKMNTPSSFIIVPYEPTFMKPKEFNKRAFDLIWIGGDHKPNKNNFEETRYNFLKDLTSTGQLVNYYGCFGKNKIFCNDYQTVLGNSRMCLSLYAFDRPLYFSNRVAHALGSKCAILSYDFKERSRIFSDDDGIFFKDMEEFKNKKRYYDNNLDELEWVSENGYKLAKKYFLTEKVIDEILFTLKNGESGYPFGETVNPKNIKYDIPDSDRILGDVYYLDAYGNFISIDDFSDSYVKKNLLSRSTTESNRIRAEKIKRLHNQKNNLTLTKRAGDRVVRNRIKII